MTDIAVRYRAAAERFDTLVAGVSDWSAPSPCEGWTARDVLDHVVTTEEDFLAQHLADYQRGTGTLEQRWAAVRAAVTEVLADPVRADVEFDGFFGPTTVARTIDRFYTADLIVHRWDIARAIGCAEHEATTAAERAHLWAGLDDIDPAVMRQPGLFGPAVELPVDADDHARLLAWLGRRP